jgi:hypothetical protein
VRAAVGPQDFAIFGRFPVIRRLAQALQLAGADLAVVVGQTKENPP